MNITHYSILGVVAFIAVLAMLVVNKIKLKAAKADAADKAVRLERYATITDAEAEAARIVNIAREAAQELETDSQRIRLC